MDKRRDLKILFLGDGIHVQSGYSVEMDWLIRRFLLEGFQVAQVAKAGVYNHWVDFPLPEGNLRMYPPINDPNFCSDSMFYSARHWGAHIVIPMIDIWGMIAANKENPPRKAFQECLEAFKVFSDAHPKSFLFIGTQQISPASFPIKDYADYLGITDKLIIPDQIYFSLMATREDIKIWLNCFDALLHPSATEGFGLTIVEAQSVGKPVLVNKVHSMQELIVDGKTGAFAVPNRKFWSNANSYWEQPDPMSIYIAMEKVYQMLRDKGQQVALDCRKNVIDNFNVDTIFKEQWLPWANALQEEILPKG